MRGKQYTGSNMLHMFHRTTVQCEMKVLCLNIEEHHTIRTNANTIKTIYLQTDDASSCWRTEQSPTNDENSMEQLNSKNNTLPDQTNKMAYLTYLCCGQQLLLHHTFPDKDKIQQNANHQPPSCSCHTQILLHFLWNIYQETRI